MALPACEEVCRSPVSDQEVTLKTIKRLGRHMWRRGIRQSLFLMVLAVVLQALCRTAYAGVVTDTSALQHGYDLTIRGELISLRAKDASLKAILEEIGRRMNIQVKVEIPEAATASFACEQMPLHEVLKRFGRYVNYGYVERWEQGKLRISTITVHSLKVATLPTGSGADSSPDLQDKRPRARLEMNIDPSKYLREKHQPHEAD
jgi:hypothetical protein